MNRTVLRTHSRTKPGTDLTDLEFAQALAACLLNPQSNDLDGLLNWLEGSRLSRPFQFKQDLRTLFARLPDELLYLPEPQAQYLAQRCYDLTARVFKEGRQYDPMLLDYRNSFEATLQAMQDRLR